MHAVNNDMHCLFPVTLNKLTLYNSLILLSPVPRITVEIPRCPAGGDFSRNAKLRECMSKLK